VCHRSMTTRLNVIWGGLAILLFLGALEWAKERDPFVRRWFTLKTADGSSFKCVAVLPKPMRYYPVVIYAHGSGGDLLKDGVELRQIAELGLATVSLEYDKQDKVSFNAQFGQLLRYLNQQSWVNTNAIAWVGFSLGANDTFDFILRHPEWQPQLLVQLSGAGLREGRANNGFGLLHCPFVLIHGDQDELFPVEDTKRLASVLQTNGEAVELKIIPGAPHGMELEREMVFRNIGECCLTHLVGTNAWRNYRSIAQWQAEAPPLWLFWLPAAFWIVGWSIWLRRHKEISKRIKLSRGETVLRQLAVLLVICALAETAIHFVPPHFSVSNKTLSIARKFLVEPKERADFEYLDAQPIWHDEKLKALLEHVELAGYNRELINWQVDEKHYQDYVLSPAITGKSRERLNWRRPLWEEFYPRIRRESSPEDAAKIVVRHLRERVTIAPLFNPPHDVPAIWLKQITDEAGFQIIYVAALRSIGIPARMDLNKHVEFWDGSGWQIAPLPSIISW
jgi:predicted esterase